MVCLEVGTELNTSSLDTTGILVITVGSRRTEVPISLMSMLPTVQPVE